VHDRITALRSIYVSAPLENVASHTKLYEHEGVKYVLLDLKSVLKPALLHTQPSDTLSARYHRVI
jgi:hypothetical protein